MITSIDQQLRPPVTASATSIQVAPQAAPKPSLAARQLIVSGPAQPIVLHAPHDPVPVEITKSPTDYTGIGISIAASFLVALATSLIGLKAIRMQLQRQSEDVQAQRRANTKAQLRLDAYKDIQAALTRYSDVESPFVRIALIRAELTSAIEAGKEGRYVPLQARWPHFAETFNAFQKRLLELKFCLERYEAILPGFEIFQTALSCALHNLMALRGAFDDVLLFWLPLDGTDHSGRPALLNAKAVTQDTVDQYNKAAMPLETAIGQAREWVFDLGVEAQNFSLAEYADRVVARRKPADPVFFTVTVDPADRNELQAKFDATEYGRWLAASLAYAHRRYARPEDSPAVG
jgi:hypothetical protein